MGCSREWKYFNLHYYLVKYATFWFPFLHIVLPREKYFNINMASSSPGLFFVVKLKIKDAIYADVLSAWRLKYSVPPSCTTEGKSANTKTWDRVSLTSLDITFFLSLYIHWLYWRCLDTIFTKGGETSFTDPLKSMIEGARLFRENRMQNQVISPNLTQAGSNRRTLPIWKLFGSICAMSCWV